ncbi:helix-turn-helix domain-containing protein [Corynebacterium auriscanis]|uniref:helix-turn-helix domain-containing protein n=1 Tax=Corynebacterium auriscanis TaxID=99807 RepID=UPI003CEC625E
MTSSTVRSAIRWSDYGPVLTPAEVAEILSISRSTLSSWRRLSSPPLVPVIAEGRVVRYSRADVRRLLESR